MSVAGQRQYDVHCQYVKSDGAVLEYKYNEGPALVMSGGELQCIVVLSAHHLE